MLLSINHTTDYRYDGPASHSVNEIRLHPRDNHRQRCLRFTLTVEPECQLFHYRDYFGNHVYSFSVNNQHRALTISAAGLVETTDVQPEMTEPHDLAGQLAALADCRSQLAEYLSFSRYTEISRQQCHQLLADAGPERASGLLGWLENLTGYIYSRFAYQPGLTTVHTTVTETLALGAGVCQDFAHLMLAVCRSCGIPARYVSGYQCITDLNTACTAFAQASHAWVEAFVPGCGWVGFDPTNNCMINWRYITVATGRDYRDITPTRGVYTGNCSQTMAVSVDVRRC
ncbi:MAG: transglutaminase family protein [Negativicutes bacterium]|nr:transglutaminase family protein [Negativicutes bacterium]